MRTIAAVGCLMTCLAACGGEHVTENAATPTPTVTPTLTPSSTVNECMGGSARLQRRRRLRPDGSSLRRHGEWNIEDGSLLPKRTWSQLCVRPGGIRLRVPSAANAHTHNLPRGDWGTRPTRQARALWRSELRQRPASAVHVPATAIGLTHFRSARKRPVHKIVVFSTAVSHTPEEIGALVLRVSPSIHSTCSSLPRG